MCLSPITIINRKKSFLSESDPVYISVPCGKCEDCKRQQSDEWTLRALYEYDQVKDNGFAIFITLTYGDFIDLLKYYHDDLEYKNYLPRLHDGTPCFDKTHIQKLIKALQDYYRNNYDYEDWKYLYTCEYGDESQRPHYHLLAFFKNPPKDITPDTFRSLVGIQKSQINGKSHAFKHNFLKLVQSNSHLFWKYGIIDVSDKLHGINAIQYVTQYISKDWQVEDSLRDKIQEYVYQLDLVDIIIDYMDIYFPDVMQRQVECMELDLCDFTQEFEDCYHLVEQELRYRLYLQYKNRFCHFHRQSLHFGQGLAHEIPYQAYIEGKYTENKHGKAHTYTIPNYYIRTKFYNYNEDNIWFPTEEGLQYLHDSSEYRANSAIETIIDNVTLAVSSLNTYAEGSMFFEHIINETQTPLNLQEVISHLSFISSNPASFYNYTHNIRNFSPLASFQLRETLIKDRQFYDFLNISIHDRLDLREFIDNNNIIHYNPLDTYNYNTPFYDAALLVSNWQHIESTIKSVRKNNQFYETLYHVYQGILKTLATIRCEVYEAQKEILKSGNKIKLLYNYNEFFYYASYRHSLQSPEAKDIYLYAFRH